MFYELNYNNNKNPKIKKKIMSNVLIITTDNQKSCNYAATCTWLALIAVFGSLALGIGLGFSGEIAAGPTNTTQPVVGNSTTPITPGISAIARNMAK